MSRARSFVAYTAARTGRSRRALYEDLQIAAAFTPAELDTLKRYRIPKRDALALARLPDPARPAALAASVQVVEALDRYGSDAHAAHARSRTGSDAPNRTRTCPACGEPFAPRRRDARWCGAACRQRAYRTRRREP